MKQIPFNFDGLEDQRSYMIDRSLRTTVSKNHGHSYVEMCYMAGGHGEEVINGRLHEMRPGMMSVVLPHQLHQLFPEPDTAMDIYYFAVTMDMFLGEDTTSKQLYSIFFDEERTLPSHVYFEDKEKETVEALLSQMHYEYMHREPWSDLCYLGLLYTLLARFDRKRRACICKEETAQAENKHGKFQKILNYLNKNYTRDITLNDLEEEFHLNSAYISSLFKKNVGRTFLEVLNEYRVRRAQTLLSSTDLGIMDIAMESGFNSYISFCRTFKARAGMTATEYRHKEWKEKQL